MKSCSASRRMAKGVAVITAGGNIEHIQLNSTDPWTEVDGERSSVKAKLPVLSDPAVRQALDMLVDRQSAQDHIYGRTGVATGNFVNNPERLVSKIHQMGVQRRQGQPGAGSRWLQEGGSGRHQGQGRQEAEVRIPDVGTMTSGTSLVGIATFEGSRACWSAVR